MVNYMSMTKKEKKLLEEKRKKYTDDPRHGWLNADNDTFAKFASSLSDYPNSEVRKASKWVKRSLLLEQNKLKSLGLSAKYEYRTTDDASFFGDMFANENDNYKCNTCIKKGTKKVEYYRGDKKIKEFERGIHLSAAVVDIKNKELITNDTYCCPNCGAINKICDLEQGCQYCKTHFLLEDIYPVVKNYCTHFSLDEDIMPSRKNMYIAGFILGFITCYCLVMFGFYGAGFSIDRLMLFYLLGGVFGCAGIWGFLPLIVITRIIFLAFTSPYCVPISSIWHKDRMGKILKKYDSNIIYEDFEGLIISYIKGIVFSPDSTKLSYYTGTNTNFSNIINVDYLNGVKLRGYDVKDNILTMKLVIYMLDTIYENNKIYQKSHPYNITIKKDIRSTHDLFFSIEKVTCKNCGGSFDAETTSECPYCNSKFDLLDYDYVISDIK